jgi:hypothetical protein
MGGRIFEPPFAIRQLRLSPPPPPGPRPRAGARRASRRPCRRRRSSSSSGRRWSIDDLSECSAASRRSGRQGRSSTLWLGDTASWSVRDGRQGCRFAAYAVRRVEAFSKRSTPLRRWNAGLRSPNRLWSRRRRRRVRCDGRTERLPRRNEWECHSWEWRSDSADEPVGGGGSGSDERAGATAVPATAPPRRRAEGRRVPRQVVQLPMRLIIDLLVSFLRFLSPCSFAVLPIPPAHLLLSYTFYSFAMNRFVVSLESFVAMKTSSWEGKAALTRR